VTATERIEPVAVDTVVTGEWIITLNAAREIYRDGAIAVSGGVIAEVGKRAAILAKYQPATGRHRRLRHGQLRPAPAAQPGGQHRLRLDRPFGRHGAHRRRGGPPPQSS
jgi:hypothetical protein